MDGIVILIFQLIVLLGSVMIHEVSHGLVAYRLGDSTAKEAGRLTLNPLKHLDPFGSVLLPLLLFFLTRGAFVFGWAKPVPYDPSVLRNPRRAAGLIAAAGPVSNLAIAAIFGVVVRVLAGSGGSLGPFLLLLNIVVFLNILLAVFNLVPLPPLDGSKVLFALLPRESYEFQALLERYGIPLLILFLFLGFPYIIPIVEFLQLLITGGSRLW